MHYVQFQSVADSWSEGLLVLMYHSVDAPPLFYKNRGLYVTPQLLARQIRELQSAPSVAGFTTLGQWTRARTTARQVAITFDDAYLNLFEKGLPVLQETGVRALTYVVASLIGKSNQWDDGRGIRRELLMDRAQLLEWIAAGHEIGSHSLTHPFLTALSPETARREIVDSKKMLEDIIGREVQHFCYPYGDWNREVRDIVGQAGYETATTTVTGFNSPGDDALALRRLLARHERPYWAALRGR